MITLFSIITLASTSLSVNCACDTVLDVRSKKYYAKYPSSVAHFPGGIGKFQDYLIRHSTRELVNEKMSYPMEFFVNKDGTIANARIIGGVSSPVGDALMLKILATMPKWIPAQCNGRPVVSKFYYKITY